jgi:hypothetical protein
MLYTTELYQSAVVEIVACSKDSYSDSMTRCGGEYSITPHVSGGLIRPLCRREGRWQALINTKNARTTLTSTCAIFINSLASIISLSS